MRIAVTGSTGFVGSNIAEVLTMAGHEVLGLVRREPDRKLLWGHSQVDFASEDSLAEALAGFDAVVHCAIANDFNRLLADREYAYDSYVGMTQRVTRAANRVGAHVVYISTDWIMDGSGHLELETNTGNPLNYYGYMKALGEQVLRDLAPTNGAICRVAGVMGAHRAADQSPRSQDVGFGYFVDSLVRTLRDGKQFLIYSGDFVNKVTTPSLAAEIGAQVERVISRKAAGTFHLVGDDAIGRLELGQLVCDVFNLDAGLLIEGEPPVEERFPAPIPVDSSLDNKATKAALGFGPTPLRKLLEAFRLELETKQLHPITQPER
jgi:dTDP-4-dehydrorhamnose reductase